MQTAPWLLVVTGLVWLVVFLLHAIRLTPSPYSRFELKRRAETGDGDAQMVQAREAVLPRIETLRMIKETVAWVGATGLTLVVFGWWVGLVLTVLLSLSRGAFARSHVVSSLATSLYQTQEKRLLELLVGWKWLDVIAEVTQSGEELRATSKAELAYIVDNSASTLTRDELLRLRASLTLEERVVEQVMTPASMIETADLKDSLGPLVLDDLHRTGHSRFPVIDRDLNHVVGILYLHDIINLRAAKKTVREAMDSRVHYIHQDQTLEHALNGFLKTHRHLFIVVNDFRETVGILTLEDVVEALLGKKIIDEFDQYEDLRAVAESNPRKNNLPKGKTDI